MNTILISLAVLGFITIILAIYLLSVATSMESIADQPLEGGVRFVAPLYRERNPIDRRQRSDVTFPLIINGVLIERDRRKIPDRRQATA